MLSSVTLDEVGMLPVGASIVLGGMLFSRVELLWSACQLQCTLMMRYYVMMQAHR